MRLIDADALKEDFKERLSNAHKWLEKAKDEEIKIRADAVITYICEVIMTIDYAPTVEPFEPDYVGAERLKARQREYEEGYHNGMAIGKTLNPKIKQGEWLNKEFDPFLKEYGQCSNCLKIERVGNFCRNCGAQMDGGES